MTDIGIRELRANAADMVRRAEAGERIVITVNGRPTAQLSRIGPIDAPATLADLAARGLVTMPHRHDRPVSTLDIELWAGVRLDRLLVEVRGR